MVTIRRCDGRCAEVRYGTGATPVGEALIGWNGEEICWLAFMEDIPDEPVLAMQYFWQGSDFVRDNAAARTLLKNIFAGRGEDFKVLVKGTPFQCEVWEALAAIPFGATSHYADVAASVGRPGAVRAVGTAVGSNPVSYLIPCHRVLPASGGIGNYRWGSRCKQALLDFEKRRT